MKPNYKNWIPKGLLISIFAGTAVVAALLAAILLTDWLTGITKMIATAILLGLLIVGLVFCCLYWYMYQAFSYNGKKQIARRIIDKVSDYVILTENGVGLDVGCGSGALTVACAKKNPQASMVGLDRWGMEYSSFSKQLCENNAKAEEVSNTSFIQGDACHLRFPDETFDAVTSNYCYHNVPSRNRQKIILETLRTLKKGGTFAIHDYFTKGKYGDLQHLIQKLQALGYEKVELLDTTSGLFLSEKEAKSLCLKGSALLVGKK